jgi:molecular chaperone DnaK
MGRLSLIFIALLVAGCGPAESPGLLVAPASPELLREGVVAEPIGIETLGGVFTPLLHKGCSVPCSSSQIFSTAEDGQSEILVHLYSGNEAMAKSNRDLARYSATGFPLKPRGELQ